MRGLLPPVELLLSNNIGFCYQKNRHMPLYIKCYFKIERMYIFSVLPVFVVKMDDVQKAGKPNFAILKLVEFSKIQLTRTCVGQFEYFYSIKEK